jgi:hypothetical protein
MQRLWRKEVMKKALGCELSENPESTSLKLVEIGSEMMWPEEMAAIAIMKL